MPSSWQKVVYTPPLCITIRLPFVSWYFCRSIRVRGRWNTPNRCKTFFWKIMVVVVAGPSLNLAVLDFCLGHPKPQKLVEMKFWDFSQRSRDKTWSDDWEEFGEKFWWVVLYSTRSTKKSRKIRPKFCPILRPTLRPEFRLVINITFVAAISHWGMSGVICRIISQNVATFVGKRRDLFWTSDIPFPLSSLKVWGSTNKRYGAKSRSCTQRVCLVNFWPRPRRAGEAQQGTPKKGRPEF